MAVDYLLIYLTVVTVSHVHRASEGFLCLKLANIIAPDTVGSRDGNENNAKYEKGQKTSKNSGHQQTI